MLGLRSAAARSSSVLAAAGRQLRVAGPTMTAGSSPAAAFGGENLPPRTPQPDRDLSELFKSLAMNATKDGPSTAQNKGRSWSGFDFLFDKEFKGQNQQRGGMGHRQKTRGLARYVPHAQVFRSAAKTISIQMQSSEEKAARSTYPEMFADVDAEAAQDDADLQEIREMRIALTNGTLAPEATTDSIVKTEDGTIIKRLDSKLIKGFGGAKVPAREVDTTLIEKVLSEAGFDLSKRSEEEHKAILATMTHLVNVYLNPEGFKRRFGLYLVNEVPVRTSGCEHPTGARGIIDDCVREFGIEPQFLPVNMRAFALDLTDSMNSQLQKMILAHQEITEIMTDDDDAPPSVEAMEGALEMVEDARMAYQASLDAGLPGVAPGTTLYPTPYEKCQVTASSADSERESAANSNFTEPLLKEVELLTESISINKRLAKYQTRPFIHRDAINAGVGKELGKNLNPYSYNTQLRHKKRACPFCSGANTEEFSVDNVPMLGTFLTETGKIMPSRVTRLCKRHQRKLAKTVKSARLDQIIPTNAKPMNPRFRARNSDLVVADHELEEPHKDTVQEILGVMPFPPTHNSELKMVAQLRAALDLKDPESGVDIQKRFIEVRGPGYWG